MNESNNIGGFESPFFRGVGEAITATYYIETPLAPEKAGLKLMDIELPSSFGAQYKGPSFGIDGCRKLTGSIHG